MASHPHPVQVRLSDAGNRWIEDLRTGYDVTRADVVRACMAVAAKHRIEVTTYLQTLKETH